MANVFDKDKAEKLDYKFSFAPVASGDTVDPDVSDYLQSDETLTTFTLVASLVGGSGSILTLSGSALTDSNKSILYWAEGGILYGDNWIECTAQTSGSRTVNRRMKIKIVEK